MDDHLTLATWNVEWATPGKHEAIRERIASWNADILVVTEGDHGVLPPGGHAADAGMDWGYANTKPQWRKAILWSRWPLTDVRTDVPEGVRSGRLVDAVVQTLGGLIRVLAVCIPWRDAHVRTGRGPRCEPWDEHTAYVHHLARLVARNSSATPLVVMGDFNQRIPRTRQPAEVYDQLTTALRRLEVVTAGATPLPGLDRQEVDHIAVSRHFAVDRVWGVDRHEGSRLLSDHDAVLASVRTS